MAASLKAQNVPHLAAIYCGTFFLVAIVHWGASRVLSVSLEIKEQALIVAAITALAGVLSHVLPNSIKHALVYWRFRNVLSGHRCRKVCTKDPRLRLSDLKRKWPAMFDREMAPREQNAYWYSEIYQPVKCHPEVSQAHQSFLLYRDAASGLLILLVSLSLWRAAEYMSQVAPTLSAWAISTLGLVVLLLCLAARQSGDRTVTNAVAASLYG